MGFIKNFKLQMALNIDVIFYQGLGKFIDTKSIKSF
jgi:hypothetical protein